MIEILRFCVPFWDGRTHTHTLAHNQRLPTSTTTASATLKGDLPPLNDSLEGGKEALKALILRVASVDHLLHCGTERSFIFHQKLGRFHMIRRLTIGSQLGCFRKISTPLVSMECRKSNR